MRCWSPRRHHWRRTATMRNPRGGGPPRQGRRCASRGRGGTCSNGACGFRTSPTHGRRTRSTPPRRRRRTRTRPARYPSRRETVCCASAARPPGGRTFDASSTGGRVAFVPFGPVAPLPRAALLVGDRVRGETVETSLGPKLDGSAHACASSAALAGKRGHFYFALTKVQLRLSVTRSPCYVAAHVLLATH